MRRPVSFEPLAGGYSSAKNVIFDNNHQASGPAPALYNASPTLALPSSGWLVKRGPRVTRSQSRGETVGDFVGSLKHFWYHSMILGASFMNAATQCGPVVWTLSSVTERSRRNRPLNGC